MICQRCENSGRRGYVKRRYPAPPETIYGFSPWWVCPDCNGTGITSCCDGQENQIPQMDQPSDAQKSKL